MHQNLPFFMKKTANNGHFLVKSWDFGLSPILRALDARKQIVGTHRSRKHNLQHPYAPNYAIFHENRPKMAFLLSNINFLALYKQLKHPPLF